MNRKGAFRSIQAPPVNLDQLLSLTNEDKIKDLSEQQIATRF